MRKETFTPHGGPPRGAGPSHDILEALGEEGVYNMVADFYFLLASSEIAHLFPQTDAMLIEASRRNAAFLIQMMGGPARYSAQFGEPRMRKRHLSFVIDENAREVWLKCFYRVLDEASVKYGFPGAHLAGFKRWLADFSAWMVNAES